MSEISQHKDGLMTIAEFALFAESTIGLAEISKRLQNWSWT